MTAESKQPAAKKNPAAKAEKKDLTATVAPFDIKDIKLKAQATAGHIQKSIGSIIVHDAKIGLKEAEVWLNKITGKWHISDLMGNVLENVSHVLTIPKK